MNRCIAEFSRQSSTVLFFELIHRKNDQPYLAYHYSDAYTRQVTADLQSVQLFLVRRVASPGGTHTIA